MPCSVDDGNEEMAEHDIDLMKALLAQHFAGLDDPKVRR